MDEKEKLEAEAAAAAEAAKEEALKAVEKEAEDNEGSDDGSDGDSSKGTSKKTGKTDEEVDAIVEKRLARERAKMEREIRQKLAEEADEQKSEAEKLKNMTELQRAQYEAKKIKAEKEELQSKLDLNEQTAIARKELSSAGINLGDELLSMFVSPNAEQTATAIDQLKELWPKAVNEAVQKALTRDIPDADKKPGQKSFGASFAEKYSNSKFTNGGKE